MLSSPSVLLASVSYLEPEVVASWPDVVAYVDYDENVNVVYSDPVATSGYPYIDAELSYIEAYSITSWVDVAVSAQATMPDVFTVDVVSPVDELAFYFSKSLSDVYSFNDTAAISFLAQRADTFSIDTKLVRNATKKLSDSQNVLEALSFNLVKAPFLDGVLANSIASLSFTKRLSDTFGISTDFLVQTFYKALTDSVSLADAVIAYKEYIRNFSDDILAPDLVYLEESQPKTDSASVFDSSTIQPQKNVSESLYLLDNMDGDIEYIFIKLVSELLLTSDTHAVAFFTNKADNLSTISSGSLTAQNYCDITYFLEDYVGVSRTFT